MRDMSSQILSRRGALSALVAALASACDRKSSHSAELVHIALSNATSLIHLPVWLAQDLGYFREEGLAISFDDATGSSKAAEALMAGSVDIVSALFEQAVTLN